MAVIPGQYIWKGPDPVFEPSEGGLGYEIFRALSLHKGKQVQHIIETGETLSYQDLLKRSVRTAIFLAKKKLQSDDIILMCSGNSINFLVPLIASKFVDVLFASMEPSLPLDDVIYLLNLLQPKVLFVAEDVISKIEESFEGSNFKCEIISLGTNSTKYVNISDLFHPVDEEENYSPSFVRDIKKTAVIFLSSGTTGKPKGVCVNHYSLLGQSYVMSSKLHSKGTVSFSNISKEFSCDPTSSIFQFSPLYWVSGFLFNMVSIFCGGCMVLGSSFEAKVAWDAMERYKPDTVILPPGQTNELCTYGFSKKPITSVSNFATGGGLVSSKHMRDLKRCFPNTRVTQVYGQTENAGALTLFNSNVPEEVEYQEKHLNSCGRPTDGIMMKIKDIETGKSCGPCKQGELLVKNIYIMNGYFKMDSSSVYDSDGWFKTGDVAYFDENGYLYIVDRIKDILLYTIHNITPSTIENILKQHPAVHECCVVGMPHPRDNEHPMGIVVLREDFNESATEEDIVSFVNDRVTSDWYKLRAGITFVSEMLRTGTGKFRKIEMKRRITEGIRF